MEKIVQIKFKTIVQIKFKIIVQMDNIRVLFAKKGNKEFLMVLFREDKFLSN
jgi:hypothetical protein